MGLRRTEQIHGADDIIPHVSIALRQRKTVFVKSALNIDGLLRYTAVPRIAGRTLVSELTIRGRDANGTTNYPLDFLRQRRIHTGWYVIDAEEAATPDGKAAQS